MNELRRARPAAVAGKFYPKEPEELREAVKASLCPASGGPRPKVIIVPHAGYQFSGATAGGVYSELIPYRDDIGRVIILATAHRTPECGLIAPETDIFATPLGMIAVDVFAVNALAAAGLCSKSAEAHAQEHSIEVQLPFIQMVIGHCKIVPFVVGPCEPECIVQALETLDASRDDTLVVVSSDLSHFLSYDQSRVIDRETAELIEKLDQDKITTERMCGAFGVRGVIKYAKRHGYSAKTLEICNSGDRSGSTDQVVGYGGFAFYS